MVVSIGKIGVAHADYYTGRASGQEGYYTDAGEKPGRWVAAGAMNVGGGVEVTTEALRAALSCVDPGSSERLGRRYDPGGTYCDRLGVRRRRKALSAYDVTYSVPKSVSVAWALADEATRREIEAAFDASTAAVVAYLQRHAVASRAGAGGTQRVEVPDGATVARFDHRTSRSGDPQLHAHLLFMNRVLCADGVWRTLDGRLLYSHAMPASLYGAAVLRVELSRRLGWNWDRVGANLHAEIAGRDDALSQMWSQRSREVAREAQRRVRDFEAKHRREPKADERLAIWNQATVASRASKELRALGEDPHARWRSEAAEAGIDPAELIGSYPAAQRVAAGTYDRPEVIITAQRVHVAAATLEHLVAVTEQTASGLTDVDIDKAVLATITANGMLSHIGADGPSCTELVDRLGGALRQQLHQRLVHHDNRWYSPGLLAAEVTAAAWLSSPAGDLAAARARLARLDLDGLGADQAEAARQLVASLTAGSVVVGPAGAGKTTMLARVADAAGAHNVVATAPTAVAAATLGEALGVRSDTVARLLTAVKNNAEGRGGSSPIPAGGTVIIDEASQLATRDLAAVCGLAAACNARVILVGDPAQQGSISAGGMFAALAESRNVTTVALAELWRFTDPAEAAVTVKLRAGDRSALDYHRSHGRVTCTAHAEIAEAVADWWQDHATETTAMSAPTRDIVEEINTEIARRRAAAGQTGEPVLGEGPTTIRVGDTATTRRNARRIVASDSAWVKNGDRWIVEGVGADGGVMLRRFDGDVTVEIPLSYAAEHLQLGYAVTQTRAQSLTVDAALTVATISTRLSELYVGLTRGTRCNHLLVVTDHHGPDEDNPPDQIAPDDVLEAVFARRGHQTVASDPAAGRAAYNAAVAHLAAVAATDHTRPLPVPDSFDAADVLARADQGELRRRAEDFEHYVEDAIDAWAAQLDLDEHLQHRDDAEVIAALNELRALEGQPVPNSLDAERVPVGHLAAAPPDTAPEPVPAAAAPPPQLPPGALISAARAQDLVGPGPAAAQYDALGWSGRSIAYDVFDLGASNRPARQLLESQPAVARLAPDDNPRLVELVVAYQRSEHAGDVGAAARLSSLVAAVVDPPLRRRLKHHPDIGADPDSLHRRDQQWAHSVRRDVLHRRAATWSPVLDALEARRETLRSDARATLEAGHLKAVVTAEALCEHDRTLWAARCLLWLDSDATAAGLLSIWTETNSSLAAVAAGEASPCAAQGAADTDPPWRTLTALPPSRPAPAPLPQGSPDYCYPLDGAARQGQDPTARPRAAAHKAAEWYYHQLLHSPDAAEARNYLLGRGIGPDDWQRWQIGWAPNQWRAVTNHINDDDAALDAGIAAESKHGRVYDVMRGRVMLPICDPDGAVVAFAGRTINDSDPDAPKYLNTRTTALWAKANTLYGLHQAQHSIAATGDASLVEGYLDVIAAHRCGITNAVAACGTAITPAQISTLDSAGVHQLHIALDGDDAGRAATRAALRLARDSNLPARVVNLPQGADPDSLPPDELNRLWQLSQPQPWAAITAELRNGGAPSDSIETRVRYIDAILNETTRTDALTRLVAIHQTAVACGLGFTSVLNHDRDTLADHSPAGLAAAPPTGTSVAAARAYGLSDDADPHHIQDITAALESLNTPSAPRCREPARSL